MKIFFASLFLLFLFSTVIIAQKPTPTASPTPTVIERDEEVVKISTNLIQIDVTVTDKKGKIITDLKPEDFEVYENNQKQNITNFSFVSTAPNPSPETTSTPAKNSKNSIPLPPSAPIKPEQVRRTIALVVDDLTLSFESVHFVRQALKKFVDEQMQEGDLIAIVRTGGGIGALQQFTSDKRQLYAAIEKVRWNPAGNGKMGAFANMEASPLQRVQAGGGNVSDEDLEAERIQNQSFNDYQGSIFATGTLGALNFIIRGMQELPGRKSVMLMSDGFKLFVKDESGFVESSRILESLRRLTDLANRASVVVYTMDARGLQTVGLTAADNTDAMTPDQVEQTLTDRRNDLFDTQSGLTYLAQQTGGFALINNNDLSGGIRKMIADQNGYYLLGYTPDEDTFDPKTRRFNKLTIKLKRPDLKVRYRSGFFGVSDESIANSRQTANQNPYQQITTALTSPFATSGIELRLNTLFGNDVKTGSFAQALIHVKASDLKFTDEPDGTHKTVFDVLAVIFGENGIVIDQVGKSYTLTLNKDNYDSFVRDGFVYNLVFPIKKPGAYQFRVAMRDSASAKIGSANQFIDIPNLKKGWLTISGIILENMTLKEYQSSASGAPAAAAAKSDTTESRYSPQGDTALRRFKRGTILQYGCEIYNAKADATQKSQVTTQTRIFRDGNLIFEGKPVPAQSFMQGERQGNGVAGAISLGNEMLPGDYVLQIIATDPLAKEKRRIATQFVQFEIVE